MSDASDRDLLINEWLNFARENLLSAISLLKEEFAPFHTVCFLCQGSGEKNLKAYLIHQGWDLKRIHSLQDLLVYCCEYDESFESLKDAAITLDEYIVSGRYPIDLSLEKIQYADAQEAIESAKCIEAFVVKKILLQ